MNLAARFVLVSPSTPEASQGANSEPAAALFDKIVAESDPERAVEDLEAYLFAEQGAQSPQHGDKSDTPAEADSGLQDVDTSMADASPEHKADDEGDDAKSDRTEDRCIEVKT